MSKKEWVKYSVLIVFTVIVCVLLFCRTDACTQGIKDGIYLCATTVIPSLFPFMIVSQFILKSGISDFLGKLCDKPCKKVFKLPGVAMGTIIMSLIGGYPVGSKMTRDLLFDGKITVNQAQRLNLFCINAGPAFIIGTVGSIFLGSRTAGIILYASTCLASLIVGLLSSVIADKAQAVSPDTNLQFMKSPVIAFTDATADAARTMISVCAWIVIFNAIIKCLITGGTDSWLITASGLIEVTNGIRLSLGTLSIPAVAALLSFGGLSVHCQIYSYVISSGLSFRYFYTARVLCAAISAFICTGLIQIFPCEISVFSTSSNLTLTAYSISLPAAIALVVMCAILIFEVDKDKKVC